MSKLVRKLSRQQWAELITADYKKTVDDLLKLGRDLIAAKDQLEHGEFLKMVKTDLPFSARSAQRYMKIASDPKLAKYDSVSHLPVSVQHELTKLPTEAFEQAMSSGAINPKTTPKEAKALIITPFTRTISSPSVVFEKEEPRHRTSARIEAAEVTEARVILQTLETAVTELDQHVRQHGLTPAIKTGIRNAMNKLSSIGNGSESVH